MANRIVVTLSLSKETPGTVRYDAADPGSAAVPNVYVRKAAADAIGRPTVVRITIEDANLVDEKESQS
jgi:hypothetical protein